MASNLQKSSLHLGLEQVLIDEASVQRRVAALGHEIGAFYADRPPLLIGVLTGGFMFMADLSRRMQVPLRVDFMAVSSYGDAASTSGVVRILKDLDCSIENRHVLIVEDIIDSGLTLSYLVDVLRRRKPADVRIVALLQKERSRAVAVNADWVGFHIPDKFVVGYGLDYAGKYRNLPFIAVCTPDMSESR